MNKKCKKIAVFFFICLTFMWLVGCNTVGSKNQENNIQSSMEKENEYSNNNDENNLGDNSDSNVENNEKEDGMEATDLDDSDSDSDSDSGNLDNKSSDDSQQSDENITGENENNNADGNLEQGEDESQQNSTTSSQTSNGTSNNNGTNTSNNSGSNTTRKPVQGVGYPSTSGALHVEGSQLVDSNGKAIQLRGISTHGLSWFPQYVNEAAFAQFRQEWNVNVMRLAMYTAEYGGYCTGGDKEALKNLIRKGVSYATAQDMYVIVDWHTLSDSNPNTYKSEAKQFFAQMSKEFAGHNNVIYEICNEPNGGTSWAEIKSYAEEVIRVIRSNDADAVIIVGTPNWSQYVDQAAANPITSSKNIMYALHFYAATHTDSLRNTMISAINAGLPIFVSEYGICDASGNGAIDENQANKWVSVMNQYGVSYVAWNLSNKGETSAIINSSSSKTSGFTESDLSASGKWLYRMLTGNTTFQSSSSTQVTTQNATTNQNTNAGNSNQNVTKETTAAISNQNTTTENTTNSSNGSNNQNSNQSIQLTNADIKYTVELKNSWESGGQKFYHYSLTLNNTSSKNGTKWVINVPFNENVTFVDGWNGEYTTSGTSLQITSKDYNGTIASGGLVGDVGFIVSGSSNLKIVQ